MADIEDLPNPTTTEFEYYGTPPAPSQVCIGRQFLAMSFYENHTNDRHRISYEFGQEFLNEMAEQELPYKNVLVTWHTLAAAITNLESKRSGTLADDCLSYVLNSEFLTIHYPPEQIFEESLDRLGMYGDNGPNVYEIADYLYMSDLGIDHFVVWDNDYTAFPELTLMPYCYWRS